MTVRWLKTFDTDTPFSNFTEPEKPIDNTPNLQGSQIQVPQLLVRMSWNQLPSNCKDWCQSFESKIANCFIQLWVCCELWKLVLMWYCDVLVWFGIFVLIWNCNVFGSLEGWWYWRKLILSRLIFANDLGLILFWCLEFEFHCKFCLFW